MLRTLKRAKSALDRHSLSGIPPLLLQNIKHYWTTLGSTPHSGRCEFDEQFGIETERTLEVGALEIDSGNAKYAVRYQPSAPKLVRQSLSRLGIRYSDFTFVDFGAGKGRVLLIASEFPFSQIIGVEFAGELVEAARENIRNFRSPIQKTTRISVQLADATQYRVPDVPLVCYLYNPFQRPVLAQVVNNLCTSIENCRRDVYVIYIQPEYHDVFDNSSMWKRCADEPLFVVYRSARKEGRA
jgi:SAM-dependent methyltransferase